MFLSILAVVVLLVQIVFASQIVYYIKKEDGVPKSKEWLFKGVYGCLGVILLIDIIYAIACVIGL